MAKKTNRSDALGVAIKMEKEGQKFYAAAAKAARNPVGKRMFLSLVKDEERHELIFREMAAKAGVTPASARMLKGVPLHTRMEKLFQGVGRKARKAAKANDDDVKAIDIALGMEENSYVFYTAAAKSLKDPREKEILRKIAEEENGHFHMLNDTRLYLTYPEMWYIIQEKPLIDGG